MTDCILGNFQYLVISTINFFFPSWFSFMGTGSSQENRGRERTILIPLDHLQLPSIQTFINNFEAQITRLYLIVAHVINRLLLDEISHLWGLHFAC